MWLDIYSSHFDRANYIPHLKEYLGQKVRLVCDEGKESRYDGKNTGQNERITCLIVYNHLQQLHTLIYGNFLQQWEEEKKKTSHWQNTSLNPSLLYHERNWSYLLFKNFEELSKHTFCEECHGIPLNRWRRQSRTDTLLCFSFSR